MSFIPLAHERQGIILRHINVVGAAIIKDGTVLCARRGDTTKTLSGFWEFPGGKIESGETPKQALAREILEECLCTINIGELIAVSTFQYEFAEVTLSTYYCTLAGGTPTCTEHSEFRWQAIDSLDALEWAPVDKEAVCQIMKDSHA